MNTKLRRLLAHTIMIVTITSCASSQSATDTPNAKPYPLTTCIVTDNDLDSMGGPILKTYQGQQIQFCCKPCVKKFEANPAKYLAKLPR
ncbi:MAG: YHS domain-containing protein [Verrucomicrobia bacterium]|nr:MAG: YHS domain-containing protein [Verrucomicrobiota bacterium]